MNDINDRLEYTKLEEILNSVGSDLLGVKLLKRFEELRRRFQNIFGSGGGVVYGVGGAAGAGGNVIITAGGGGGGGFTTQGIGVGGAAGSAAIQSSHIITFPPAQSVPVGTTISVTNHTQSPQPILIFPII